LYTVSNVAPFCEPIDSLWNAQVVVREGVGAGEGVVKIYASIRLHLCLLIFICDYLRELVARIQFILVNRDSSIELGWQMW
jgi:hypothetical protein